MRGENKVNALSALLARSSRFIGHGRSGWELASSQKESGAEAQNENEPSMGKPVDGSETALAAQ